MTNYWRGQISIINRMVTIPLLIEIENFSTISTENLENYKIFERNCHILVILYSVMCIFINLGKKMTSNWMKSNFNSTSNS